MRGICLLFCGDYIHDTTPSLWRVSAKSRALERTELQLLKRK